MEQNKNIVKEDLSLEIWRDINGYEGYYMVSNLGRVKSLDRSVDTKGGVTRMSFGKILKPRKLFGYLKVHLSANGVSKHKFVHRLIAESFIELVKGKEFVNHKNGVRDDNNISNLEWCTCSENVRHGYISNGRLAHNIGKFGKLNAKSKPVYSIDIKTGERIYWESGNIAAKTLGFNSSNIFNILAQKQKTTKGFTFEYATKSIKKIKKQSL